MRTLFLIGVGGFVGTILRYVIHEIPHKFTNTMFPVGTFVVNFIGACIIGYFMEFTLARSDISDTTRMFIAIGLIGGFTTFSTFSYETISLLRSGNLSYAILNVLLTNVLCLSGTFTGIKLVHFIKS